MRIVMILLIVILAMASFFGVRWYMYVSNTTSPYDEVGIAINTKMPDPLNRWGCNKLRTTFGNVVPPYGCAGPDGTTWRN